MSGLLDPKNDFVFKRIFGSEENKDILLIFLNDVFKESGEEFLTDIILLNPYIDKNALNDKQCILDINARTLGGKQINIEIQLFNKYDTEKRGLYYWAKKYEEQLSEGQPYKNLKKTISINILNFMCLPNDRHHNIFRLREEHTHVVLTDDLEIHFMELPKLSDHPVLLAEGLTKWLLFLKGVQKEQWEVLAMNEPALQKAMHTLEFLSQDEETRRLYEMRQKALHDEASMIEGAKAEGKVEVAKKLLDKGMDISFVVEVTGLPETEVKKLIQ